MNKTVYARQSKTGDIQGIIQKSHAALRADKKDIYCDKM